LKKKFSGQFFHQNFSNRKKKNENRKVCQEKEKQRKIERKQTFSIFLCFKKNFERKRSNYVTHKKIKFSKNSRENLFFRKKNFVSFFFPFQLKRKEKSKENC
jgi:hypothetical protein